MSLCPRYRSRPDLPPTLTHTHPARTRSRTDKRAYELLAGNFAGALSEGALEDARELLDIVARLLCVTRLREGTELRAFTEICTGEANDDPTPLCTLVWFVGRILRKLRSEQEGVYTKIAALYPHHPLTLPWDPTTDFCLMHPVLKMALLAGTVSPRSTSFEGLQLRSTEPLTESAVWNLREIMLRRVRLAELARSLTSSGGSQLPFGTALGVRRKTAGSSTEELEQDAVLEGTPSVWFIDKVMQNQLESRTQYFGGGRMDRDLLLHQDNCDTATDHAIGDMASSLPQTPLTLRDHNLLVFELTHERMAKHGSAQMRTGMQLSTKERQYIDRARRGLLHLARNMALMGGGQPFAKVEPPATVQELQRENASAEQIAAAAAAAATSDDEGDDDGEGGVLDDAAMDGEEEKTHTVSAMLEAAVNAAIEAEQEHTATGGSDVAVPPTPPVAEDAASCRLLPKQRQRAAAAQTLALGDNVVSLLRNGARKQARAPGNTGGTPMSHESPSMYAEPTSAQRPNKAIVTEHGRAHDLRMGKPGDIRELMTRTSRSARIDPPLFHVAVVFLFGTAEAAQRLCGGSKQFATKFANAMHAQADLAAATNVTVEQPVILGLQAQLADDATIAHDLPEDLRERVVTLVLTVRTSERAGAGREAAVRIASLSLEQLQSAVGGRIPEVVAERAWLLDVRGMAHVVHDEQGHTFSAAQYLQETRAYKLALPSLLGLLHFLKNFALGVIKHDVRYHKAFIAAYGGTPGARTKLENATNIMDTVHFLMNVGLACTVEEWRAYYAERPTAHADALRALRARLQNPTTAGYVEEYLVTAQSRRHHVLATKEDEQSVDKLMDVIEARRHPARDLSAYFVHTDTTFVSLLSVLGLYGAIRSPQWDSNNPDVDGVNRVLAWLKDMNVDFFMHGQYKYQKTVPYAIKIATLHELHPNRRARHLLRASWRNCQSMTTTGREHANQSNDTITESKMVPSVKHAMGIRSTSKFALNRRILAATVVTAWFRRHIRKRRSKHKRTARMDEMEQSQGASLARTARFVHNRTTAIGAQKRTTDNAFELKKADVLRGMRPNARKAFEASAEVLSSRGPAAKPPSCGQNSPVHMTGRETRSALQKQIDDQGQALRTLSLMVDGHTSLPTFPACLVDVVTEADRKGAKSAFVTLIRRMFPVFMYLTNAGGRQLLALKELHNLVAARTAVLFDAAAKLHQQPPDLKADDRLPQIAKKVHYRFADAYAIANTVLSFLDCTWADTAARLRTQVRAMYQYTRSFCHTPHLTHKQLRTGTHRDQGRIGNAVTPAALQRAQTQSFSASQTWGQMSRRASWRQMWSGGKRGARLEFTATLRPHLPESDVPDKKMFIFGGGVPPEEDFARFLSGNLKIPFCGRQIDTDEWGWFGSIVDDLAEDAEGEHLVARSCYRIAKKLMVKRSARGSQLVLVVVCFDTDFLLGHGPAVVERLILLGEEMGTPALRSLVVKLHELTYNAAAEREAIAAAGGSLIQGESAPEDVSMPHTQVSVCLLRMCNAIATSDALPLCGGKRALRVLSCTTAILAIGPNDIVEKWVGMTAASLKTAWVSELFRRAAADGGSLVVHDPVQDHFQLHVTNVALLCHVHSILAVYTDMVKAGVLTGDCSVDDAKAVPWDTPRQFRRAKEGSRGDEKKIPPSLPAFLPAMSRRSYAFEVFVDVGSKRNAPTEIREHGWNIAPGGKVEIVAILTKESHVSKRVAAMPAIGSVMPAAVDVMREAITAAAKGGLPTHVSVKNTAPPALPPILTRYHSEAAIRHIVAENGNVARKGDQARILKELIVALGGPRVGRVRVCGAVEGSEDDGTKTISSCSAAQLAEAAVLLFRSRAQAAAEARQQAAVEAAVEAAIDAEADEVSLAMQESSGEESSKMVHSSGGDRRPVYTHEPPPPASFAVAPFE